MTVMQGMVLSFLVCWIELYPVNWVAFWAVDKGPDSDRFSLGVLLTFVAVKVAGFGVMGWIWWRVLS